MSTTAIRPRFVGQLDARGVRRWLVAVAVLVGSGVVIAALAGASSVTGPYGVAGVLSLLALLALALLKYDAAVALGLVLFGFVAVEPAPTDVVFAVLILVAAVTGRFDPLRLPPAILIALGVFLVVNALTLVQVVDIGGSLRFLTITVYGIVLAIWVADYLKGQRRAALVVRAYLVAALLSAAIGLLALFVSFPGHESLLLYGDRAKGLFKDPNVFGPFLIPAALLLVEELITPRLLTVGRIVKSLLLGVLVLGIFMSYSRAAWVSLLFGGFVLIAIHMLRPRFARRAPLVLVLVAVLAAVVVGGIVATGSERFQQRASLQSYDAQRFGTQKEGLALAQEHPLGVGPGGFERYSPRSAHSTYVRVAAEYGIVGLVSLVAVFAVTLWYALEVAFTRSDTFGIGSAALLGAWCGLLLSSGVVDTLHWRHFWLVAGLIWAGVLHARVTRKSSRPVVAAKRGGV
jgi:O-antigen ligase